MTDSIPLRAVLTGAIQPLGAEGVPSGIAKRFVEGSIKVTKLGLAGDRHADLRHHGGVDKAVHHYPHEHYAAWRRDLPDRADQFVTGGFGENLSTQGMTEETVCVGDIYRIGACLLQVSQGRSPCRKLNLRFGVPDMVARVQENGRTGWYCRVLAEGEIGPGDRLELVERACPQWSVARVRAVLLGPEIDRDLVGQLARLPQLAEGWREKARNKARSRCP